MFFFEIERIFHHWAFDLKCTDIWNRSFPCYALYFFDRVDFSHLIIIIINWNVK
jgi:hypothetical protein